MNVSTEDIWNEVKAILKNDAVLSTYMTKVYEGVRDAVPDSAAPYIIMEPVRNSEETSTFPLVNPTLTITIAGVIMTYDKDAQIIGNSQYKGILDVEKDIKVALAQSYNLNGKCEYFKLPDTSYGFRQYPLRGVEINMAIYYRQDFSVRA